MRSWMCWRNNRLQAKCSRTTACKRRHLGAVHCLQAESTACRRIGVARRADIGGWCQAWTRSMTRCRRYTNLL